MRSKIIILGLMLPMLTSAQIGRFKNLTIYDTLTVQDTAVLIGFPGQQTTDTTIILSEPTSGNSYEVDISSYSPAIDYTMYENNAVGYFTGFQNIKSISWLGDSLSKTYLLKLNPYAPAIGMQMEVDNDTSSMDFIYNLSSTGRSLYMQHQDVGDNSTRAKLELDEDFFEISLQNSSVFKVDTAGLVEFDSLTDGTKSEAVSDLIYPSHGWARFDSTLVIPVTQNVYTIVTNTYDSLFRAAHLRGVVDVSGDTIILGSKSHFAFNYAITFSGTASDEYIFRVMLDGSELFHVPSTTSNVSQRNSITLPVGVNADAGSRLWVEVTNTASGDDPTIYSGSWYIFYLHRLE